jgi:hypothetical protein
MTKEELLAEALRRYPIGTKFKPAHMDEKEDYCIVTNTNFKKLDNSDYVIALNDNSKLWSPEKSNDGNTTLNRAVYAYGKWATIIDDETSVKPEVKKEEKTTESKYVVCIRSSPSGGYIKDYVFEMVREKDNFINTALDCKHSSTNGFSKTAFRTATIEEASLYKKHEKPVSIDELKQKVEAPKKVVKEVVDDNAPYGKVVNAKDFINGEYYQHKNGNILKWISPTKQYYIWYNGSRYDCGDGNWYGSDFTHLDPFSSEALWLDECFSKGKFVDCPNLCQIGTTTSIDKNLCAEIQLKTVIQDPVIFTEEKQDSTKQRLSIKLLNDLRSL